MIVRRIGFAVLFIAAFGTAGCDRAATNSPGGAEPTEAADAPESGDVTYPDGSLAPETPVEPGSVEARLRDASLATQVKMQLVQEAALRPYTFDVTAEGGRVTLAGDVASAAVRTQAEQIASRVQGVREVRNRIAAPGAPPPENLADEAAAAQPQAETQPEAQASDEPVAASDEPAPPAPRAEEAAYHTVQSGESLWIIARRYDLSVDRLKSLNDLRSNSLRPGQRLRVN